jgi:predicted MPP superfamily phosphohydrolase
MKKILTSIFYLILITVIISILALFYIYRIEPEWIEVKQINITLPHLDSEFQDLKLVQISDIHISDWMTKKRFEKIINLVNKQKPDFILITGDFFTSNPKPFTELAIEKLSELKPKEKTLGVLGNHDHWGNAELIREIIKKSNIIELANSVYIVKKNGAKLYIAGVDDWWVKKARLDLVLEQLPTNETAILLVHEPDFADISARTNRFDLELSGHSHGGQVKIPFKRPPVLPPLGRKYPSGIYKIGQMLHYTNRGVGVVKPYVRFNCRPEITVFNLS